jgi:hypothetical protein
MSATRPVLWLSAFSDQPSEREMAALQELYGKKVTIERQPTDDVRRQAKRIMSGHYCAAVAIMPLTTLNELLPNVEHRRIPLLWAEAETTRDPELIEFRGSRGQGRRFSQFREIAGITVELSELDPRNIRTLIRFTDTDPDETETEVLRRLFGEKVNIQTHRRRFETATEIVRRFTAAAAEEALLVNPRLSDVKHLISHGIRPLRRDTEDDGTISVRRIERVEIRYAS